MLPVKPLYLIWNFVSSKQFPISEGIPPLKELNPSSMRVSAVSNPIEVGMVPENLD
jgi:hypothetical protein